MCIFFFVAFFLLPPSLTLFFRFAPAHCPYSLWQGDAARLVKDLLPPVTRLAEDSDAEARDVFCPLLFSLCELI